MTEAATSCRSSASRATRSGTCWPPAASTTTCATSGSGRWRAPRDLAREMRSAACVRGPGDAPEIGDAPGQLGRMAWGILGILAAPRCFSLLLAASVVTLQRDATTVRSFLLRVCACVFVREYSCGRSSLHHSLLFMARRPAAGCALGSNLKLVESTCYVSALTRNPSPIGCRINLVAPRSTRSQRLLK